MQLVSAQRTELERRSLELREERTRALAALEEAEERATALERLSHEAEHRARVAEQERSAEKKLLLTHSIMTFMPRFPNPFARNT